MSEPHGGTGGGQQGAGGKLFTLSEMSRRTGISMPTLQRYKKLYQHRIPSSGAGRKQRYPESALAVFAQLRSENEKRRGRPRKNPLPVAKARGRAALRPVAGRRGQKGESIIARVARRRGRPPVRRKPRATGSGLLTLTQISKSTGISYPTLVRYVKLHLKELPHEGQGRKRRFHPEAEAIFVQLRARGGRGGRPRSTDAGSRGPSSGRLETMLRAQVRALEKSQVRLERKFKSFSRSLQKLFK